MKSSDNSTVDKSDSKCEHIGNAGINKHNKYSSNGQESFNNIQRMFYTPRRGIKSTDSYLFDLFMVWYNFVRPHGSIKYTPAEAACVQIHGMDKWRTLIENACVAAWGRA